MRRRKTKTISIGNIKVGCKHPVSIQSMAKTATRDISATVRQIKMLEKEGCEVIRLAVKNIDDALSLSEIKKKINIPLVADIHFNYRLALEAAAQGADGLRLNPGNIYRREEVKAVALAAKKRAIPIRVGVNSGSLRGIKAQAKTSADLMVANASGYIKMLEKFGFYDIIVSLKASDIATTVSACKKMAALCDYPFHLGITACGLSEDAVVKSAIGIGSLLLEGIGDTIRVSLTGRARDEVRTAKQILQSLRLRRFSPEIIACPTCGRTEADIPAIASRIKKELSTKCPVTVAVMGCEVNGPGEAREADIGVACGKNTALVFKKGEVLKKIQEERIVDTLVEEIEKINQE